MEKSVESQGLTAQAQQRRPKNASVNLIGLSRYWPGVMFGLDGFQNALG